jgi:DNA-binding MarR family transcriptional regulator
VQASTAARKAASEVTPQQLTKGLAALIKHLLHASSRDFFAELEHTGISLTQLKTLALLSDADEPMSVKALSDAIGLSLPGVSRAVDGLVRRGDLTRAADPRDGRSKLLSVTARGRRTLERLLAVRLAGVRGFVDELEPQERQALAAGIEAVERRLVR